MTKGERPELGREQIKTPEAELPAELPKEPDLKAETFKLPPILVESGNIETELNQTKKELRDVTEKTQFGKTREEIDSRILELNKKLDELKAKKETVNQIMSEMAKGSSIKDAIETVRTEAKKVIDQVQSELAKITLEFASSKRTPLDDQAKDERTAMVLPSAQEAERRLSILERLENKLSE